jgi:hypothetical protein
MRVSGEAAPSAPPRAKEVFRMNSSVNPVPLPAEADESSSREPEIMEEIEVEDLAIPPIRWIRPRP